ncbi:hypothetical protein AB6A40_009036 [Gnathostoma spinigerum]|uniref:peptidyl-tRNA hydrolase n=1 Tax=Gnathostoma spinigerum TaxID=75299 RepID=A0ABD6F011_9BILA
MSGNGPRVMYLILRYDLLSKLQWPLGALVTQAAHAATACLWTYKDDPDVIEYMDDIEHMRKVALKVDNEDELQQLHKKLDDAKIDHRVWIEDDMAVCIAVKPQPRSTVSKHLKSYSLFP